MTSILQPCLASFESEGRKIKGLGSRKELDVLPVQFLWTKELSSGIFHELRPHVIFPVKTHYKIPTGFNPTGYDPTNQTRTEGKNPQELNPVRILRTSFDSKEA